VFGKALYFLQDNKDIDVTLFINVVNRQNMFYKRSNPVKAAPLKRCRIKIVEARLPKRAKFFRQD
ncbi:MAG: hypothetical protein ABII06_19535, partial [Pseudomonadota bacterium]